MITAYYTGYHVLSKETSFETTSWMSMYSGFVDDPLSLSLGTFANTCKLRDIAVEYLSESRLSNIERSTPLKKPLVIIVSGYSDHREMIFELLSAGANMVYIEPVFGICIDAELQQKFQRFKNWLLETANIDKMRSSAIAKIHNGQLFYIKSSEIDDHQIERGPFGYSEKIQSQTKIEFITSFVESITTFSSSFVDLNIVSIPKTFPLYEPFQVDFSLRNLSCIEVERVIVDIQLPDFLAPISSTYWEMEFLQANSKTSILLYCKPKYKQIGNASILVNLQIHGEEVEEICIPLSIKVTENLGFLLRKSIPRSIDTSSLIVKYKFYFEKVVDHSSYLKLLDVDPDSVISKARKISEHLTKLIAAKYLDKFNQRSTFANLIQELSKNKIINNKIRSYLDTIRIFGNLAVHSQIDEPVKFSNEDSVVISNALLMFIKECIDRDLLDQDNSA